MSNLHGSDFGGAERLRGAQADRALAALATEAGRDVPNPGAQTAALPTVHAAAGLVTVTASRIGYPYVYAGTTDNTADGVARRRL
ncbi:MAG: hypothetical protein WAU75_00325 [Solirubrobacteraceae bacterium]